MSTPDFLFEPNFTEKNFKNSQKVQQTFAIID
jgi:hypothetical protein